MNFEWLHDGLISLFWLVIWILLARSMQLGHALKGPERKLFWLALGLKFFVGLLFGFYFMVIKAAGDAYEYYACIRLLWEDISHEPAIFFQFLMASPGDEIFPYHIYFTQGSPLAMIKVGLIMSLFSLNSFWGMCILLSGLGFWASWSIFKAWRPDFDSTSWWGAACLFFLPSVLFWGGGWGKDGFLWLAICWVLGGLLHLRKENSSAFHQAKNLLLIGLGGFLIAFLKEPLLGMLLVAMIGGFMLGKINKMPLRPRFALYFGGFVAILLLLFWQQRFFVELLSYQQWHVDAFDSGQSAYQIPTIRRIRELLLYLPYLALSGLFRPAPWEWTNALVIIGGVEVLLVLAALVYWIRCIGLKIIFSNIKTNSLIISLLIFVLCLSVASALFSQNFGTLLRYRMPAMVLFLLSLWPMSKINSNK